MDKVRKRRVFAVESIRRRHRRCAGGACKDGKAHGDGVAEWYSYQRPPDRCECSFVAGKAEGMGSYRWSDGVHYVGEFKAGVIEGKGFIRYPDNEMYEGDFKNGYPDGWGVLYAP